MHSVSKHYLGPLLLFYSPNKVCSIIGCNRTTLDRWLRGRPIGPRWKHAFERAIETLDEKLTDHEKEWGFGEEIAELISRRPVPKFDSKPLKETTPKEVILWLEQQLIDGTVSTKDLQEAAKEALYTWPQVVYASKKLGVIKHHRGAGRGSYSDWRLPRKYKVPIDD